MAPVYPYLAGQYAAYLELQLDLWREGTRGGDPLNVMENIAKQMTDEQVRAVSLYFASVRPAGVTPAETAAGAPPTSAPRSGPTRGTTPPGQQPPPTDSDQPTDGNVGAGPAFGVVPQGR